MTRIDGARRVLRIPNNDFLPGISRNIALEQAFVGNTHLAMGGIGHVQFRRMNRALLRPRRSCGGETEHRQRSDSGKMNRLFHRIFRKRRLRSLQA
jgi:hypothetical protein